MIAEEDFRLWKEHPITIKVFELLKVFEEDIKAEMCDVSIITAPDGHLKLNYLAGNLQGTQDALHIQWYDLIDEETNENSKSS